MEINEKTTFEAWKSAINAVMRDGREFIDTNSRQCKELVNLKVEVVAPEEDVTKPIDFLNESDKWVYPPTDEIENIVMTRRLAPAYNYSYGPTIFNFQGKVNQVDDFIIPLLKKDPVSRRAIISLWDPVAYCDINNKSVPGLISMHFRIVEERLNVTCIIRSNDMFFGWPANVYQAYVLQSYVAKKLNKEAGSITTISLSAHLFIDQEDDIRKVFERR